MESNTPDTEGEWALHNPVKVITNEDMAAYREEMCLKPFSGPGCPPD